MMHYQWKRRGCKLNSQMEAMVIDRGEIKQDSVHVENDIFPQQKELNLCG